MAEHGKPLPPPLWPWWARTGWRVWEWITWPLETRCLKRAGFRRTGFMTWEYPPEDQVRKLLDQVTRGGDPHR